MKNSQKYVTAPENRQFFAFPDFCGGGAKCKCFVEL